MIINNKHKKRLYNNFFSLSVLQAFTYALPLLTLPYLVRVLGVENFGLISFAYSFLIFFNILIDFGFNLSATREISINRDNQDKLTEIYSSVIIIKFLLLSSSFFILMIIIFSFEKFNINSDIYLYSYLWVIGQALFPIWYFQGIEKMKYITIVNITSKIIFTILIFFLITEKSDYIYVPILNGFGSILGSLYSLYILNFIFKQKFKLQNIDTLKIYFMDSISFFLSRVSTSLFTISNSFVLGLLTNNTIVGYYSIAEKLYQALQQLYQPLIQVLYPYIAKEKNIILFKKVFYYAICFNLLTVSLSYNYTENIFSLLFTSNISDIPFEIFRILILGLLLVVPSILLGYPFIGALGYSNHVNYSVILTSIIHMAGLSYLYLTNDISIYSIAILTILSRMVDFTYRVIVIYYYRLWNTNLKGSK